MALCLRRVAGAAEASCRRQLRDGRRRMARVTALVRGLERLMRQLWIGSRVTRRAVAAGGVVVAVTILALGLCRRQRERDWRRVTFQTRAFGVHRVKKIHRPRTRIVAGHCHRHRRVLDGHVLVLLVARRAAARRRGLMVADRAAARRLECQAANPGPGHMTYEARKLCVPRVRERVGGGRRRPRER